MTEKNEENLLKLMQEFKFLDEKHKHNITRYKSDNKKTVDKYS